MRASFASLVHRRRLVRSMGEDPFVLLTLAALGGASGRSPLSPSRDHRSRDRRYSDRRYSIASPASENRLIVVIAASTRPDHLLSSSLMRSTRGTIPFILLTFAALGSASGRSHSSPTPKNKGLLLRCGLRISHVLVPFCYKNGGCCFGCHFGFPNAFLWGKGVREIRPFLTGS